MSETLRRVALVHQERVAKLEKKRLANKKVIARRIAYFKDTGILDMWNEVKDIKISNPVPDIVEGFIIPLGNLVDATAMSNIVGTGLVLHDKKDSFSSWEIETESEEENAKLIYKHYTRGQLKGNWITDGTNVEYKKQFVDSFIAWLSRHITPAMLAEMDIDMTPPSLVKKSRKILQLAEA